MGRGGRRSGQGRRPREGREAGYLGKGMRATWGEAGGDLWKEGDAGDLGKEGEAGDLGKEGEAGDLG